MSSISSLSSLTQDQFLKLLTAELRNQDPTNPISSQDLVTQMSQVSTVSGIAQLNAFTPAELTNLLAWLESLKTAQ